MGSTITKTGNNNSNVTGGVSRKSSSKYNLDISQAYARMMNTESSFQQVKQYESLSESDARKFEQLLVELKKTNNPNLKNVEEAFFLSNIRLLYSLLIGKYNIHQIGIYDKEDIVQEAYMILFRAVKNYNDDKYRFSSYFSKCLPHLSRTFKKALDSDKFDIEEFDEEDFPQDILFDEVISSCLRDKLELVLGTLEDKEQEVIRLLFGLDDGIPKTQTEIAEMFKVSRPRIHQLMKKGLVKLRHPSRTKELKDFLVD